MKIWKKDFTLYELNNSGIDSMPGYVGIEFTAFGDDFLTAKMPVDHRTKQPMGLLHGGASVVLAETIGSVAGILCVAEVHKTVVGVEINANHLRSALSGWVFGTARPVKIGRRIQVWNIEIKDEQDKLICVSRFTAAVTSI